MSDFHTRHWLSFCAWCMVMVGYGQVDASWWRDELLVMGEGGIVWRKPEVAGSSQRISTGAHTDGYWGLGARVALRNTMVSLGWQRHTSSLYYVIKDQGISTVKSSIGDLAYTSLPVRIGQRFPVWNRHVHVMPYLALVWSFTDGSQGDRFSRRGPSGIGINGDTGDTVYTAITTSGELVARNTFTVGPGLELNVTFGRWTVLAGLEYLRSTSSSLEYTVAYSRQGTLSGSYEEQATIRLSPTVLAMRWGVLFHLRKERVPDAGSW